MTKLTQEIVRELLDYDPDTGILTWKARDVKWFKDGEGRYSASRNSKCWNSKFAGKEAFSAIKDTGYKHGHIFWSKVTAHRIIWLWWYGEWPKHTIDHINGNPADNRISNLRDVEHAENCKNQRLRSNNTSGVNGVSYNTEKAAWDVKFTVNGKTINYGRFKSFEEACKVANSAKEECKFHKNHGRVLTV